MNKKYRYDLNSLLPIAITVVVVALVVAYGLQIMGETKADMTADSYEANATQDGIEAVAKISTKLGTIVTVVLAVVVIGVLIFYFGRKMGR